MTYQAMTKFIKDKIRRDKNIDKYRIFLKILALGKGRNSMNINESSAVKPKKTAVSYQLLKVKIGKLFKKEKSKTAFNKMTKIM